MKVSIMKTWVLYDIDYSKRSDCLFVVDILEEEMMQLKAGTHKLEEVDWVYELVEIPVPIVEEEVISEEEVIEEEIVPEIEE